MVDISKAASVQKKEIKGQLDRMEFVEALRHGNIYEVFAKSKTFKISDFHEFFADQWKAWKGQVIQDSDIKATEGAYIEPNITQFAIHHKGTTLSSEDGKYFSQSMVEHADKFLKSSKFKATEIGETGEAEEKKGPMTLQEVEEAAQGTLNEWDQFMGDAWMQIMDAQMISDYKNKMETIQKEVKRIIELVKQGAIGPEFALIAIAKVNATRNGVLMTWLGKKAYKLNESLNKIADDLKTLDPATDPRYTSELQSAQSKTRDGAYQLNLVTSDIQKVMQDTASTVDWVKSSMDEMNRTRREIITKVSAH